MDGNIIIRCDECQMVSGNNSATYLGFGSISKFDNERDIKQSLEHFNSLHES